MKRCFEWRLIGGILIERGLITPEQLERALAEQGAHGSEEYIGEVLVRLGCVAELDIVTALVLQCHLPYIAVSRYQIDPDIARQIPAELAWRGWLVPLDRIGNILSVVMLNPLNEEMRCEVESATGCQIASFISTKSEIGMVLKRLYSQKES